MKSENQTRLFFLQKLMNTNKIGTFSDNIGKSKTLFLLLALFTVTMWGLTFVSTKSLINAGMSPFGIFMSRFAIAYLCILLISHKQFRSESLRDELFFVSMGLSGGSLYFMTENSALGITFASNVAMLISTTPLLTLFAGHFLIHTKITSSAITGGIIALAGVALVVYNGAVNIGLNPLGDLLTILAALCWAVYCVQIKQIDGKYSNLFITRKVFFYGLVTGVFFLPFVNPDFLSVKTIFTLSVLQKFIISENAPVIIGNLLFLGVVASFLCYFLWNITVKAIGPEKASNFIYFNPLVAIIASSIILHEQLSIATLIGAAAIITGVYLSTR